jgi:hypothetical protein
VGASSCTLCASGRYKSCQDDATFRDAYSSSCSAWQSVSCTSWHSGYSSAQMAAVRAACPIACGIGCGAVNHSAAQCLTITANRYPTTTAYPVADGYICPRVVTSENWLSGESHGDTFRVTQSAASGGTVTVVRTDTGNMADGWTMNLQFQCCTASNTAASSSHGPTVVIFNPPYANHNYSSVFNSDPIGHSHGQGRLNSNQAWSAAQNVVGEWWQVDIGPNKQVVGVLTQGRSASYQRVTAYTVSTSLDGNAWAPVDGGNVFAGNVASSSPAVTNTFAAPVTARYVRIIVQSWNQYISMRGAIIVRFLPSSGNVACVSGSYWAVLDESGPDLTPQPTPPPPPPPVVITMTIPGDVAAITSNAAVRAAFEAAFATDIATHLGIAATRITVTSIAAGSIVVTYSIAPDAITGQQVNTAAVQTTLASPITFTTIKNSAAIPSSITAQYASPVTATGITATGGSPVTCNTGQYKSGSSCTSCPAGRYQSSSSHTFTSCTACAAGTYIDFTGSSVCSSCSSGTTSSSGASSCVLSDMGVPGHPVPTTSALISQAASDKATSVAASLTLPIPAAAASAILNNPTVKASFKASFEADMAAKLGSTVSPSDVTVTSIAAGSLIVAFDVHASGGNELPDAAATLTSGPIAFSTLSSDPIVYAAVGTTFSAPITPAAVIAAYSSNACANAASICGSHATCATKPSGFQCTCNAGYGTSPAANTAASCAQPAPAMTAELKTSLDPTESEASSSGVPIAPIVGGAVGLFLICASIAVCEKCSAEARNKVTVIEEAQTHDETQILTQPVVPIANAPVANVPTANASPMPVDPGTSKTLLFMQQQTAMQQSLVQQQSMMQQQHMQHMERDAHQERAERAAAQERADRQASLERVHIHYHSAHSEVTPALQAANAIPTAEALAANSTDEPPDTLARQSTAEMVAVLRHKGYNVTDEPGIAEDTSVQETRPKEDDSRSPSRTEDSTAQQTTFSASALSALSVKQLRGAYTPLCHDHGL